jgi:hypothetical protein
MLNKPKNKKDLIKLLQEVNDFNVLTIEYGKRTEIAEAVRKVQSSKQLAVIVVELR